MTLIKVASVLFATALAESVFPVPGGPYKRTPLGGSIPKLMNLSGFENSDMILHHIQTRSYLEQRKFNNLSQFLNLLFASTNIAIRHIWFFFYLHHGDRGIYFGGERDLNLILVTIHADHKVRKTVAGMP
jgi:hypothetical protein